MEFHRAAIRGLVGITSLAAVPTVAAHTGTTHAGTPHWILLALLGVGLGIVALGAVIADREWASSGWSAVLLPVGVVVAGVGAVGLVEIQVVAAVGPSLDHLYPLASLLVGAGLMIGSLVATRVYWPERPRYAALGGLLGAWVAYPAVLPNDGITNPLGYALVLGLPVLVGYVLWVDARGVLRSAFADRFSRSIGAITGLFTAIVVSFSAGTMSVNPDPGVNAPTESFVTTVPVADPLVTWPAVEFFWPVVPLAGMLSVGTVLLFGLLGGLVGINAAVVTDQWRSGGDLSLRGSLVGSLTTTGATACCCCAPAMYGVVSALFGTAATPIYWAFMDSSSPLSASFLAASVLLLTASAVYASPGPPGTTDDLTASVSL